MLRPFFTISLVALPCLGASDAVVWREVAPSAIRPPAAGELRDVVPERYRAFRTDADVLRRRLAEAPAELPAGRMTGETVLPLPMPDGSVGRFRIVEASIMDPVLQAKFPEIRTYRGAGLDDPSAVARLDLTPLGFHAMVLSASGTVFVDPWRRGDASTVVSYFRRDFAKKGARFVCEAVSDGAAPAPLARLAPALVSAGPVLRTYRLALAADVEYVTYFGGTKAGALAAMTTTMNRVNGVYERDLGIRMVFVAREEELIFPAEPDGYTNDNSGQMSRNNTFKIDSIIGSGSYDIGHVFGTGSGGLAGLGVVCRDGQKGSGTTGIANPVGDPFDIDYVAHEMGHQFGANHPFNGTTSNCGGGNRASVAAYEPGSGSTIMAYAGICGEEDLQPHSDDYFHAKSLEEILTYVAGNGGSCPTTAATGNTTPVVSAGGAFTIPKETPFTVTASGSDADAADSGRLTYCWEEYDLGAATPPQGDDGQRPIFRSYSPTASPARAFPSMAYVLANANVPPATYTIPGRSHAYLTGEALPSQNRTMTLRVTVRDNRPYGDSAAGGMAMAETQVAVASAAGPFRVTAPNGGGTWAGGSSQTVTWDAAGTAAAPVSCAQVRILLSTDGGRSFPVVLKDATPNDGTESVTVPAVDSTQARVEVVALGNIFFDVSDASFTIATPNDPPTAAITSPAGDPAPEAGVAVAFAGTGSDPNGDPLAYSWTFGDGTAGASGASASHAFANAGSYVVTLTVSDGRGGTAVATRNVTVSAPTVSGASLLLPVVLETAGAGGSFYTSELTLASRAATPTEVLLSYTASVGGGSGFARLTLAPGEQRIVPGAVAALRTLGLPIAADDAAKVGTLLATFGGASADQVFAGARTFTRDPKGGGGTFGLFYAAQAAGSAPLRIIGLQQNGLMRSNVALVNGGAGTITLRVALFDRQLQPAGSFDQTLGPWGWAQLNSPLPPGAGGRALVTRLEGSSPFTAYGVLNDAVTSDGSFIPPLALGDGAPAERIVPIVLSTGGYGTELTMANERTGGLSLTLTYTGSPQLSPQGSGAFPFTLGPGDQRIEQDAIAFLRIFLPLPPAGSTAGGALVVKAVDSSVTNSDLGVGARTFIPAPGGGTFGLFYPGLTLAECATTSAWVYGLQQNDSQRSNLAIVNRGDAGDAITLRITYFDAHGTPAGSADEKTLAPGEWAQYNRPLESHGATSGYAKVERISGSSRWLAYGVLNDQTNSDGSYVPMVK